MTTTGVGYDLRAYTPADEPAVLDLLQAAMAGGPTGRRTPDFFRWKHEHNPFGRSYALVAADGGQVVGFRTFMRWRFSAGDRTVEAVRAVDTATHPDHQGRGVFRQLTLAALEDLRSEADLVFNTPNGSSLPGYLKMGWQVVGTVPVRVRPVRLWRFTRGVRHVSRGVPPGSPPPSPLPAAADVLTDSPRVAELLATQRRDGRLTTPRTLDYLRWRYADAPDLDYRALPVEHGNDLVGLGIGRLRRRGPLVEFALAETIVRAGDRRAFRRLLRAAARAGGDYVATIAPAGVGQGYLTVPRDGITLTANPLRPLPALSPASLGGWDLALGDLEVF
jgi:GNAT superfamily N-acetyltransferase